MAHAGGAPKGNRNARKHGLSALKQAIRDVGLGAMDQRTTVARALAKWRSDLVADLGGEGTVSTQQMALVELAVESKLMLDSVDAWLLQQPTLVNKRRKTLLPVVRERQTLADGLARYLSQLGLERREREPVDLAQLLAREGDDDGGAS